MKAYCVFGIVLVAAVFACGCASTDDAIRCVPGNVVNLESAYSFVYHGDDESYVYELPEDNPPIEPGTLSSLICKALKPFSGGWAGTGGSAVTDVHNLAALKQARRVGSLLSEWVQEAGAQGGPRELAEQFESYDYIHGAAKFDSLVKRLRKAADREAGSRPELRAILLLILGSIYESGYYNEDRDIDCLVCALQVYNQLAEDDTAPAVYRETALLRASEIFLKKKQRAHAKQKFEKLLKEYRAYSDWQFYDYARWTGAVELGIEGHDTIYTLLETCSRGDSRSVLACLGALRQDKCDALDQELEYPFTRLWMWAKENVKKGLVTEEVLTRFNEMRLIRYAEKKYPRDKVRQAWLWWLQERRNFPPQRLPEDMQESKLLKEFVEEIRKDPELAKQHKDLLEKTLKEIE